MTDDKPQEIADDWNQPFCQRCMTTHAAGQHEHTVQDALDHAEAWYNETSQCGDEANVYPDLVLLRAEVLRLREENESLRLHYFPQPPD